MPSWGSLEAEAPGLVSLAHGFLDAHAHKTIATLRRDGSPRISGTEILFADGDQVRRSRTRSLAAPQSGGTDDPFAFHRTNSVCLMSGS